MENKPYTVEAYESLLKGIVLGIKLAFWPLLACGLVYTGFAFAEWNSNPGQWAERQRQAMAVVSAMAFIVSAIASWPIVFTNHEN